MPPPGETCTRMLNDYLYKCAMALINDCRALK